DGALTPAARRDSIDRLARATHSMYVMHERDRPAVRRPRRQKVSAHDAARRPGRRACRGAAEEGQRRGETEDRDTAHVTDGTPPLLRIGTTSTKTAPLLPFRRPQPRPYASFLRGALGLRNRLQGGI